MKKYYVVLLYLLFTVKVFAQICTPDSQYTTPGYHPDSATGLPNAGAGVLYTTVITIVTPIDSLFDLGPPFGIINATFDSIVIQDNTGDGTAVNGLPPGFTFACDPPSCSFPGGTSGCLLITGTASLVDTGIYNLVIENDAYMQEMVVFGNPAVNMNPLTYYKIEVKDSLIPPPDSNCTVFDTIIVYDTVTVIVYDTVLVAVTDTLIIDVSLTGISPPNNTNTLLVYPNPTNDQITINNGDYLSMTGYTVKIINSIGQDVFSSAVTTPQFVIDISTLGPIGLYFIQVIDGNNNLVENRKLILE